MTELEVGLEKPYKVVVGHALLGSLGEKVRNVLPNAKKAMLVSDSVVAPLYMYKAVCSLKDAGFEVQTFCFEQGEENKNFATYETMITLAAEAHLTREDVFVALGGGVVGDLTGFAAGTYMRGVEFVQVPTTLLAGIDAAIGGKTGLDLPSGKNLVGVFHQPKLVLFDLDTLDSLPKEEWQNGLGEGVKYAVLCGGQTAKILEQGLDESNLEEFAVLCAKYKIDAVVKDETEHGVRKLLNLGHTVGHAIEVLERYQVKHGVAVAKGVFIIAKSANKHGNLQNDEFERIENIMNKYDFDCNTELPNDAILEAVKADKKTKADGSIDIIDIASIGNCIVRKMSLEQFGGYING